jgi:hypothetical protein
MKMSQGLKKQKLNFSEIKCLWYQVNSGCPGFYEGESAYEVLGFQVEESASLQFHM